MKPMMEVAVKRGPKKRERESRTLPLPAPALSSSSLSGPLSPLSASPLLSSSLISTRIGTLPYKL
jgi:hypothetical protein